MNLLAVKAAGALFIAGCLIMSGWILRGWKDGSELSKSLQAQQEQFKADLEVKNENLELVDVARADLSHVRVRLQACKTNLGASASEVARTRTLLEERQTILDRITERIKSDALECDRFIEDLRTR